MSEHFNGKEYENYLNSLEKQLNKPSVEESFNAQEIKTPACKKQEKLKLRKSTLTVLLCVAIVCASLLVTLPKRPEQDPSLSENVSQSDKKATKKKVPSFAFNTKTLAIPDTNDAKTAIIINKSTGKVVAARMPHLKTYAASTIKIMTLIVAVENIDDLSQCFTMTYKITDPLFEAGASVAGFLNEETVTITDLLYGLILPSGADAAMALAIKTAGSEEEFVKLMNKKAKKLGLHSTHFTNCTGLYDEDNYTSAYDMAIILEYALQNKLCKKILTSYTYTTSKTPQHPEGIKLFATLFSHMYGTEPETATILGGKTGFVNESGYCIASFGKANESKKEYIIITLGNSAKWPAFYGQIDLYKQFAK